MKEKSRCEYTLKQIASHICADLVINNADLDRSIEGIGTLVNAQPNQIAFMTHAKYYKQLPDTQAAAVIISAGHIGKAPPHLNLLVHSNPYLGFAKAAQLFDHTPAVDHIAASAIIAKTAKLSHNVVIGAGCVIEDFVEIGDNTVLKPNVVVCHHVKIGCDCLIHPNTVIGSDGFGNAWDDEQNAWHKVPQLGSVIIGDDVEVGANTTIDRGTLTDTTIGNNVRIDNLVQIAHNVVIGDHTAIAAQTGIAGSVTIGERCLFAGQVGINGHIEICDGVIVMSQSGVARSIREPGVYSAAFPAKDNSQWRRDLARINRLGSLIARVKCLEKKLNDKND